MRKPKKKVSRHVTNNNNSNDHTPLFWWYTPQHYELCLPLYRGTLKLGDIDCDEFRKNNRACENEPVVGFSKTKGCFIGGPSNTTVLLSHKPLRPNYGYYRRILANKKKRKKKRKVNTNRLMNGRTKMKEINDRISLH